MAKLIVKGGSLVWDQKPGRGGHVMYILQWLEGLRRLGHDVLYYDKAKEGTSPAIFQQTIERWWNPHRSALVLPDGQAAFGLDAAQVEQFAREAAAVISLGCTFEREPEPWLAKARPRVLIDQDPGFSQIWASEGDPTDVLGTHDMHFTVGAHIGTRKCDVESHGIDWKPIWNPVVLTGGRSCRLPKTRGLRPSQDGGLTATRLIEASSGVPKRSNSRRFSVLPRSGRGTAGDCARDERRTTRTSPSSKRMAGELSLRLRRPPMPRRIALTSWLQPVSSVAPRDSTSEHAAAGSAIDRNAIWRRTGRS